MRTALPLSIAVLAAILPTSLGAAQELPPAPPIGEPKPFQLPATDHYQLPNGLAITLIPYGVAPKTVVSLRVQVGGLNEGDDPWLSDVAAELMTEGAGERSSADLATAAAGMGGKIVVGSGNLTTQVTIDVLSEHAPKAIALVGDVAQRPALPGSELARIKTNLGRRLAQAIAQPGVLADVALARTLYGDAHPFGRPLATLEQLDGYTLEQVKAFHATEFGAKRAHLYVAGRFDAMKVKAAIHEAFGDWAPGPEPLALPGNHAPGPLVILVDRPGAPQTTLRLAFDAPLAGSPDDIAYRTMNQLLGGAFISRITTNIREDKGYTYAPVSDIDFTRRSTLESLRHQVDLARFLARGRGLADQHLVEVRAQLLQVLIRPRALEHLRDEGGAGLQGLAHGVERQLQEVDRRGLVGRTDAGDVRRDVGDDEVESCRHPASRAAAARWRLR